MNPDMLPPRVAKKIQVDEASGCWLWTGSTRRGYAYAWWPGDGDAYGHRVTYHLLVDPTSPVTGGGDRDTIDHVAALCAHRPTCVNPAHMERVSIRTNTARAKMRPGKSSRFIGVSRKGRRWVAQIQVDRKANSLGVFDTEVDAARAYDAACVAIGEQPLNETHGLFNGAAA